MIEKLFKTRYSPNDLDEEFLDKIGVLAFGTFFNMYKHYPADYNYDDHFGVIITIDGNGKKLQISQIEIAQMKENAAPILFYELEQKLRSRYSDIIK